MKRELTDAIEKIFEAKEYINLEDKKNYLALYRLQDAAVILQNLINSIPDEA